MRFGIPMLSETENVNKVSKSSGAWNYICGHGGMKAWHSGLRSAGKYRAGIGAVYLEADIQNAMG
jgi:hypothetical protein